MTSLPIAFIMAVMRAHQADYADEARGDSAVALTLGDGEAGVYR